MREIHLGDKEALKILRRLRMDKTPVLRGLCEKIENSLLKELDGNDETKILAGEKIHHWEVVNTKFKLIEDKSLFTEERVKSIGVTMFAKTTGEIALYLTILVEKRGVDTILEELNNRG